MTRRLTVWTTVWTACAHLWNTAGGVVGVAFPIDVAAVLTGASVTQLRYWARPDVSLLRPELDGRPRLYSFRDLVALRAFVHLRKDTSLQRIRKAIATLHEQDLTEHPSRYSLVRSGKTLFASVDGEGIDVGEHPGQVVTGLDDIFAPFISMQGRQVVDFRQPRPHLAVRETRLGGWPTIAGTRVPFDTVAQLAADGTVPPDMVKHYYPRVEESAVRDALSLAQEVADIGAPAKRAA